MNKYKMLAKLCEKNMSQRKLAKIIGVNKDTVSSWITGKSQIPSNRIEEFCIVLDIHDSEEIMSLFFPNISNNNEGG